MIRVSKWSGRVALARTYLDMASACLFGKLQYYMLYCGLLLCSKVTHIIDPHRRNTLRYFPSKRMDFRSSTARLHMTVSANVIVGPFIALIVKIMA